MSLILCIETATAVCSLAAVRDGKVVAVRETDAPYAHSAQLTVFIKEVMEEMGVSFSDLDAVAVSKGPGSFTGLRIGVSAAKGLCYALDKPLIGISTLQAMACGMAQETSNPGKDILYCPMIDARRMEVYTALYDHENKEVLAPLAEIINADSFSQYFKDHHIVFAGDGAAKCRHFFDGQARAYFAEFSLPSAKYMTVLAEQSFLEKAFENVAYFEPYYLKDFVAGKPHVKGLK